MVLTQLHYEIMITALELVPCHIKDFTQNEQAIEITLNTSQNCINKITAQEPNFTAEDMRVLAFSSNIIKKYHYEDLEILSKIPSSNSDINLYKTAVNELFIHLHSMFDIIKATKKPPTD